MNNTGSAEDEEMRVEHAFRENIVLWKHPIVTVLYFCRQVCYLSKLFFLRLLQRRRTLIAAFVMCLLLTVAYQINGPHQSYLKSGNETIRWCAYWLGLGVLSSIGLGTGLHTFILYLGPHIAAVTLAAYECKSVDFPEPPYPDEIICPSIQFRNGINVLNILSKVRVEALMWGAGTALGELPPYFIARGARLSSRAEDSDEIKELLELERVREHPDKATLFDRLQLYTKELIETAGFSGILLCASIPNPFFDLAGVTCGHFLVPFWTFFGATLIGKALIKIHIQQIFVIFIFNENQVDRIVNFVNRIPYVGKIILGPFKDYLAHEKQKLFQESHPQIVGQRHILAWLFEKFVFLMICYFIIQFINSLAQNYHKRIYKERRQLKIA